ANGGDDTSILNECSHMLLLDTNERHIAQTRCSCVQLYCAARCIPCKPNDDAGTLDNKMVLEDRTQRKPRVWPLSQKRLSILDNDRHICVGLVTVPAARETGEIGGCRCPFGFWNKANS